MNNTNASSSHVAPDLTLNSLTKEKLNIILQRAKQLQATGEKEDGKNEFSQLMNLLRLLQQQQSQAVQQQKPQLQQQPQPQPQQQQQLQQIPVQPMPQQQQLQQIPVQSMPQQPVPVIKNESRSMTPNELQQQQQQQQLQLQLLQQHLLQQQQLNNQTGSPSPSSSLPSTPTGTNTNQQQQQQLQYQMLAYNFLAQNNPQLNTSPSSSPVITQASSPASTSHTNNNPTNTNSAVKIEPAIPTAPVEQPEQVKEPPKTMAERLVEAIYQQASEFNSIKKKSGTTPLPLAPLVTGRNKDTDIVTALDLLSGQQRS
ncbi:hypothetical protein A0J61_08917, partial [Choanephora cucurbitarum]